MNKPLAALLAVFAAAKLVAASLVELGNDEVYYILYARYPDWSHFDHPPMVGWMVQLFTLNLSITGDVALRLGPVVLGTCTLYFLYRIGKLLHSERAGLLAAVFGAASVYTGIIGGMFVMPDSPQLFFWTGALFTFLTALATGQRPWFLLTGLLLAGALATKYHSVFLVAGVVAFAVFHQHNLLRKRDFWLMLLTAAMGVLPVLVWNIGNGFVSFSFHGERIVPESWVPNPETFGMELLGQLLYQNPIVFVVTILALVQAVRYRSELGSNEKLLLWVAIPLYLVFTGFALYRRTLPHWTGPAFVTLLPLVAVYTVKQGERFSRRTVIASLSFAAVVLVLGSAQIRWGVFTLDPIHREPHNYMKDDATLDMWGWKELSHVLSSRFADEDTVVFFSRGWFPTAHVDHYISRPMGAQTIALGKPEQIHKFWWTNSEVELNERQSWIYITDSRNFRAPEAAFGCEVQYAQPDTIWLERGETQAKAVFLYRVQSFESGCVARIGSPK